jgi:broad specificity polyphosphatase/5'/3'-nucleotidase SurE
MVKLVTEWIVKFSKSEMVRELKDGQYLTISIPEVSAQEIKGVKLVTRSQSVRDYDLTKVWEECEEGDDETEEVWLVQEKESLDEIAKNTDIYWYQRNYIVIVPMRVDENDSEFLKKIEHTNVDVPSWPVSDSSIH